MIHFQKESNRLLEATLDMDEKTVASTDKRESLSGIIDPVYRRSSSGGN